MRLLQQISETLQSHQEFKKIEIGAFAGINQIGTVTFEGSTKYVAADAFMNSTGIKLVYKKGIKEAQTELSYDSYYSQKEWK